MSGRSLSHGFVFHDGNPGRKVQNSSLSGAPVSEDGYLLDLQTSRFTITRGVRNGLLDLDVQFFKGKPDA